MPEYEAYIDWLETEKNLDSIETWEELDRLKIISQRKIEHEGQRQVWEKVWGEDGDVKDNKPRADRLLTTWTRLNNKEQATQAQELERQETEQREQEALQVLQEEEVRELARERETQITPPAEAKRVLTQQEVRNLLTKRSTSILAARRHSLLRRRR